MKRTLKRELKVLEIVKGGRVKGRRSEEHTLNSSHTVISYAVFCLKKKKKQNTNTHKKKKHKKIK